MASELFPLLSTPKTAGGVGGLTIGFACGLFVTFGTEKLGNWLEVRARRERVRAACPAECTTTVLLTPLQERAEAQTAIEVDVEHPYAARSSELLSLTHRDHIREHLNELVESIGGVEHRAQKLLAPSIPVEAEEELSEAIDEQIHLLHYKLDHTRRLLEGSESGSKSTPFSGDKAAIVARVHEIKSSVEHLVDHFGASAFDAPTVLEVHAHMNELEGLLTNFHSEVQEAASYWPRGRHGGGDVAKGSRLPLSLLAAVYVDSFIDGFLIGIACIFSQHAGLVLAAANVLEMGFVGASFANTVSRCNGSSRQTRFIAIYVAPPIMLAGAAIGAAVGDASKGTPAVFTGFVAFGSVALLFLVTHELLIEAHEAMKENEVVWINSAWLALRCFVCVCAHSSRAAIFYLGIYLVLLFNRYLP